jgi:hypothetical protein
MKVKTLLAKASACNSEEDAATLLDTLMRVFGEVRVLSHLPTANMESYMEEGTPSVRFEVNSVISDYYISTIRPEIRDKKLVVAVMTNYMLCGHGMHSRLWDTVEGMDDLIEALPDQTVTELARDAASRAIANHCTLLERAGVPRALAQSRAKKSW